MENGNSPKRTETPGFLQEIDFGCSTGNLFYLLSIEGWKEVIGYLRNFLQEKVDCHDFPAKESWELSKVFGYPWVEGLISLLSLGTVYFKVANFRAVSLDDSTGLMVFEDEETLSKIYFCLEFSDFDLKLHVFSEGFV